MMVLENSNKHKILALAVAVSLHGLMGVGLATMPMLQLEPPKVTKPLEIQMITLNQEESLIPPEPVPTPVTVQQAMSAPPKPAPPKPAPKQADPVKPKPQNPKPSTDKPKSEPKNTPAPKADTKQPKRSEELLQQELLKQEQVKKAFELQQQRERAEADTKARLERERAERERAEANAKAERDKAEADAKAERDRAERAQRERAEADAKARLERERAERERAERERAKAEADAKAERDKGNKGEGKGNGEGKGGELKGQNLSISNASWRSKPNFSGLSSDNLTDSVSFTARLTIDAKGTITAVSGVNTGDRALDKQISQAIRRAKLHPFKSPSGQPMSGTATYSLTIKLSG